MGASRRYTPTDADTEGESRNPLFAVSCSLLPVQRRFRLSANCLTLFDDRDLDRLAEAALATLERAGAMYQSEVVLDALERAGATVDRTSQRARLPRGLLNDVIARQQARAGATPFWEPNSPSGELPGITLQVAQFYYDHAHRERRPGNRADLVRMVQFGDALDERLPVSQVLVMREEPPLVEAIEATLVLLENTARPGDVYAHFAAQFPYLEEIGELCAGDPNRFLTGGIFMVSPMRMDRRSADYIIETSRRGRERGVGTMPVSGVSAPVTRAGAIVIGAADILAGWAAAFALDPELPMSGGICSGSADMATGTVSFCSPEAMIQDLGCVELFRRRFGGHVGVAGGADYTNAKFPGYQAGFEKAFEALTIAAYTGEQPRLGAGLLDSGKTFSPLQLLIDRELQGVLWRFAAGAKVDDGELALDTIVALGAGIGSSHLESEHTLKHFRQSLWFPALLDRGVWRSEREEEQPDRRLLERAQAQLDAVLARYRRPEVDGEMLEKARAVAQRARRELVG
jgi:trimethylamine--corrinoid protein Co-methyltransferase